MIDQNELIPATVGETLRRERISRNLTIVQVARQLRLPVTIIEDLEQDRMERLVPLYRRGFISNYAAILDLDPAPLLARMDEGEPPPLQEVLPVRHAEWKFEKFIRIATYALATTVIIPPLIWFFVHGGSRIFEREVADAEPVVSVPGDSGRVSQRIAQALALSEPGSVSDATHISASTVPLQAMRPGRDPASDPLSAGILTRDNATDDPAVADSHSELMIEMSEDSWVEIIASDGMRLEYDLLRAGTARSYRGQAPFQVLLGRASAARLLLDGEHVSFPGEDRADVTQFDIPAGEAHGEPH